MAYLKPNMPRSAFMLSTRLRFCHLFPQMTFLSNQPKWDKNGEERLDAHSCPNLILKKQLLFTVTNSTRELCLCQLLCTWPCWTPAQSHFSSLWMAKVSFLSSTTFAADSNWCIETCSFQTVLYDGNFFSMIFTTRSTEAAESKGIIDLAFMNQGW